MNTAFHRISTVILAGTLLFFLPGVFAVPQAHAAVMRITPSTLTLQTGQHFYFSALFEGEGVFGTRTVSPQSVWTSANEGIVRHVGFGQFVGVAPGTATVTATYQGVSGQATVTVIAGPQLSPTSFPGNGGSTLPGGTPTSLTKTASNISNGSVEVRGLVNPNNAPTSVYFEYGTTQFLGSTTGNQTLSSGNGFVSVSARITNLFPNTKYYFRVAAQNRFGTSKGEMEMFSTGDLTLGTGDAGGGTGVSTGTVSGGTAPTALPSVSTRAAANIGSATVTLQGSADPKGGLTVSWFEYGTTSELGTSIGYQNIGSGAGSVPFTASLTGLEPDTQYYVRAAAQNALGASYGTIANFRTTKGTVTGGTGTSAGSGTGVGTVVPAGSGTGGAVDIGTGSAGALELTPFLERSQEIVATVDADRPKPGDTLTYTLTYRNAGGDVPKVTMTLIYPGEVEYMNANPLPATTAPGSLTFDLGTIAQGEGGSVNIRMQVKKNVKAGTPLMFFAVLTYAGRDASPQLAHASYVVPVYGTPNAGSALAIVQNAPNGIMVTFWLLVLVMVVTTGHFAYHFVKDRRTESKDGGDPYDELRNDLDTGYDDRSASSESGNGGGYAPEANRFNSIPQEAGRGGAFVDLQKSTALPTLGGQQ